MEGGVIGFTAQDELMELTCFVWRAVEHEIKRGNLKQNVTQQEVSRAPNYLSWVLLLSWPRRWRQGFRSAGLQLFGSIGSSVIPMDSGRSSRTTGSVIPWFPFVWAAALSGLIDEHALLLKLYNPGSFGGYFWRGLWAGLWPGLLVLTRRRITMTRTWSIVRTQTCEKSTMSLWFDIGQALWTIKKTKERNQWTWKCKINK